MKTTVSFSIPAELETESLVAVVLDHFSDAGGFDDVDAVTEDGHVKGGPPARPMWASDPASAM